MPTAFFENNYMSGPGEEAVDAIRYHPTFNAGASGGNAFTLMRSPNEDLHKAVILARYIDGAALAFKRHSHEIGAIRVLAEMQGYQAGLSNLLNNPKTTLDLRTEIPWNSSFD